MVGTRIPKDQFLAVLQGELSRKNQFTEYDPKTDILHFTKSKLFIPFEPVFRSTGHAGLIPKTAEWLASVSEETAAVLSLALTRQIPESCRLDNLLPNVYSGQEIGYLNQFYRSFFAQHMRAEQFPEYMPLSLENVRLGMNKVLCEYGSKHRDFPLLEYQFKLISGDMGADEFVDRLQQNVLRRLDKELDDDFTYKGFSRDVPSNYEVHLEHLNARSVLSVAPQFYDKFAKMTGFSTKSMYLTVLDARTFSLMPGDMSIEDAKERLQVQLQDYEASTSRAVIDPFLVTPCTFWSAKLTV